MIGERRCAPRTVLSFWRLRSYSRATISAHGTFPITVSFDLNRLNGSYNSPAQQGCVGKKRDRGNKDGERPKSFRVGETEFTKPSLNREEHDEDQQ
jgi:hypothetical protein